LNASQKEVNHEVPEMNLDVIDKRALEINRKVCGYLGMDEN
jgi:hypothetical protein